MIEVVIVGSEVCKPCDKFVEEFQPAILEELAKFHFVHVTQVMYSSNTLKGLPEGVPKQLNEYVKAFPSMIAFDKDQWENAKEHPDDTTPLKNSKFNEPWTCSNDKLRDWLLSFQK